MNLRLRAIVLVAAAVTAAVVSASAATYLIVEQKLGADANQKLVALVQKADQQLPAAARVPLRGPGLDLRLLRVRKLLALVSSPGLPAKAPAGPAAAGLGALGYTQYVDVGGGVTPTPSPLARSLQTLAVEVAAGRRAAFSADGEVAGLHARVLTMRATDGLAVQVALPLGELDRTLSDLRTALLLVSLAGIGLAGALALLLSRAILRPVLRLTETAERVTQTRDLSDRIDVPSRGELGRLAAAFDRMLGALEESSNAQRQLVADASHELRTPLASIRMNIELLAEGAVLAGEDRERLVGDLASQIRELGAIIGDLVDLARDDAIEAELEELRLDLLVEQALARARRNAPDQAFELHAEPCIVRGAARQLISAISNMLDNAIKWSPPGEPIKVTVRDGEVLVRDHGPGIAEHDLPLVFDRFYRAQASRGLPGSGLGLAIVRHAAKTHGGEAHARNAPDGGAVVSLSLPAVEPEAPADR